MKDIDRWLSDEAAIGDYRQGIHFLKRSGILGVLGKLGLPTVIDSGRDVNAMAGQAHQTIGFHNCLNLIENFEDVFKKSNHTVLGAPTFGGIETALKRGDLKKGE